MLKRLLVGTSKNSFRFFRYFCKSLQELHLHNEGLLKTEVFRSLLVLIFSVLFLFSCTSTGTPQVTTTEKIIDFVPIHKTNQIETNTNKNDNTVITNQIQKHQGAVTSFDYNPVKNSFFSAGSDGFIYEFLNNDSFSFWQVSDIQIKNIAVHPNGSLIAVYETDGYTIHRISVWNWDLKQKLYAKRFKDSIVSLSWSAKGSLLFIGNTSLEGLTVLEAMSGNVRPLFSSSQGIISIASTGESESTVITYGPSGKILYSDIQNGKEKASFFSISDVQNSLLYANNSKIAGIKENSIIVIDAINGKKINDFFGLKPIILSTNYDPQLAWIVDSEGYTYQNDQELSITIPVPLDTQITQAIQGGNFVYFGTSVGDIYKFEKPMTSESSLQVQKITTDSIHAIDSVASDNSRLFILSKNNLFLSAGPGKAPVYCFNDIKGNKVDLFENNLFFWSNIELNPIILSSFDGENKKEICYPKEIVKSLSFFENKIIYTDRANTVHVVSIADGKEIYTYTGTGIQEAVMLNNQYLCISRSSTSKSPNPLLLINIGTGETVPIPISGDLCYGLQQAHDNLLMLTTYLVKTEKNSQTDLLRFTINPTNLSTIQTTTLSSFQDEDLGASINFTNSNTIFSTLGKNNFYEIDLKGKQQIKFDRTLSLPSKIKDLDQFIVSLNYDGSLSWFDKKSKKYLSTTYITTEGFWLEYKN